MADYDETILQKAKRILIGKAKDPSAPGVFHNLSLIAFFAWVGLGADGLSSSCYGPEEAFRTLHGHPHLAIIVALASAVTIFIISASYSQIVELFPHGGGGYMVATKLLSPACGMVSGCALLIDYVLTITLSVASGMDAIFSFLPPHWHVLKLAFALAVVLLLIVLNLRGIKESVLVLLPIFLIFIIIHACGIIYALASHAPEISSVASGTAADFKTSFTQLGLFGISLLLLRAYSMGAGTFTGIEAVSNGVSILREPKVQTAKRTMIYMAVSLSLIVLGLMFSYLLYNVAPAEGKTLNAILFEKIFGAGRTGYVLLLITLLSEATLLFVAAQTGFIDGPRVIANMAVDRWFPTRFTMLSDRLVIQNGILLMGAASVILMILTRGSVRYLVVLYSINVFITFVLSQLGMIKYWWKLRRRYGGWLNKMAVNGIGFILAASILISLVIIKFGQGGWLTFLITGSLVIFVSLIKRHYNKTAYMLRRLDALVESIKPERTIASGIPGGARSVCDPKAKTAVILVNGFNGLGLHTLLNILRLFKGIFKNFVFVQVGIVDSGVFKGPGQVDKLREYIAREVDKYVCYVRSEGYCAEGISVIGVDVVEAMTGIAPAIIKKFPDAIFFGGQLVFPEQSFFAKWLHNYTIFAIQRKFYYQGIPVMLLPIKL